MRIRHLPFALCLVFLSACWTKVAAQQPSAPDTSVFVLVYTTDGNQFVGKLRSESLSAIVLHTDLLGDLTIQRSAIRRMDTLSNPKIVNGRRWFDNRHAPRYFVGPSAYGLRKGEGVFENSELFFNQVSYGFSDHFSLGVGFAPFFIFWDGPFPIWLTPKVTIPLRKDQLNLAIGGFFGRSYNDYIDGFGSGTDNFAAAYSVLTYGSRDANITVGLGFPASNNNWYEKPMFYLAGSVRLANNIALLGESYFYRTDYERMQLFGLGVRFMGRAIALDAGVAAMNYEYDGLYPIPYGTLHIPFGKPRN